MDTNTRPHGSLTRAEAIEEACSIVSMAYQSRGDFQRPSDCFCKCYPASGYQNTGEALAYVRAAVVAALERDGYVVKQ